jgi:hypothetical protein
VLGAEQVPDKCWVLNANTYPLVKTVELKIVVKWVNFLLDAYNVR